MVEDGGETNTREPLKRYVKQMNFPYSYIYIKTYIHNTNTCTSINHFMKVHFMTLHFYKRPTVRNSKRIFNFMKKKKKDENSILHLFVASHYRGSVYPKQQEWHSSLLPPATTLSISASGHQFWTCLWASELYLDLYCASVSKVCPKVTYFFTLHSFSLRKTLEECSTFKYRGKPVHTRELSICEVCNPSSSWND